MNGTYTPARDLRPGNVVRYRKTAPVRIVSALHHDGVVVLTFLNGAWTTITPNMRLLKTEEKQ